jgi:hypothetical protein
MKLKKAATNISRTQIPKTDWILPDFALYEDKEFEHFLRKKSSD